VICPFCESEGECIDANGKPRAEKHFTRQLAEAGKLVTPVITQRELVRILFGD